MQIDTYINRFLLASRLLFNGFFAIENPREEPDRAWDQRDLFNPVQEALFKALVLLPLNIEGEIYGSSVPQPIKVLPNTVGTVPIMINREIHSGYWDFPLEEWTNEADLRFLKFFDWSDIFRRDNRYVMAKIVNWPQHPEVVGKFALIESQYCSYET